MKKVLRTVLAVFMLLIMLSACSSQDVTSEGETAFQSTPSEEKQETASQTNAAEETSESVPEETSGPDAKKKSLFYRDQLSYSLKTRNSGSFDELAAGEKALSEQELSEWKAVLEESGALCFLQQEYDEPEDIKISFVFSEWAADYSEPSEAERDSLKKQFEIWNYRCPEKGSVKMRRESADQFLEHFTGLHLNHTEIGPEWYYLSETDSFYRMELKQSGEQYHIMAGARISDDEIWLHGQKIGSDYDGAVKMKREGGKWHFAANRFFFPPYKDITAICLYTDSFRDIKRTVPSILDEKLEERSYDDFREYYSQYPVITRTADYSLIYISDAEWLERAAQDPLIEERLLQIDKKLSDEKLTEEYRILYIPEQGRELIFGTGNHKLRSFGEYDRLREIRGNRDLEASELEAFQSFFSCNDPSYPFPIMFLLSTYDDPRNIDLHILFYN